MIFTFYGRAARGRRAIARSISGPVVESAMADVPVDARWRGRPPRWRCLGFATASEPAAPGIGRSTAPPGFHILAKPSGPICNLDCSYCFFLEKEALYPGDRFRMPDDVLAAYIRQLIESHLVPEVTIAWQGGEPTLMGLDFFRRAVAFAEECARPGQTLHHTIQTNGTLLTDEWCEFLREKQFLVGISIDGPEALHDVYRVDKQARPTVRTGARGSRSAHRARGGLERAVHGARGQPGRAARGLPLLPRRARRAGSSSSSPSSSAVEEGADALTDRSVDPEAWGRFLVAVFDEWVRRDVGTVFVQMFDAALASWYGAPPALCIFGETCGNARRARAQRRPVLVRPFRRPRAPARQHHDHPHGRAARVTGSSGVRRRRSATPCPGSAGSARCCSRAGASVRRTGSRLTADGEAGLNHLCAGYLHFFTHVDGADAGDGRRDPPGRHRRTRSCRCWPGPGATTRAPAGAAARPSTVTAPRSCRTPLIPVREWSSAVDVRDQSRSRPGHMDGARWRSTRRGSHAPNPELVPGAHRGRRRRQRSRRAPSPRRGRRGVGRPRSPCCRGVPASRGSGRRVAQSLASASRAWASAASASSDRIGYRGSMSTSAAPTRLRDHEPGEPLLVRRDHVPRRCPRAGVPDHVLVGGLVLRPSARVRARRPSRTSSSSPACRSGRGAAFAARRFETWRNIFTIGESVVDEGLFPLVDLAEAPSPERVDIRPGAAGVWRCEELGMDPDDEHLLVVRSVEDPDLAASGQVARRAPEEMVCEFLG